MNRARMIVITFLGALTLQALFVAFPAHADTTDVAISTIVIQGLPPGSPPNTTITFVNGGQQGMTTVALGSSINLNVDVNSIVSVQSLVSVSSTERYAVSGSGQFNSGSGSSVT